MIADLLQALRDGWRIRGIHGYYWVLTRYEGERWRIRLPDGWVRP